MPYLGNVAIDARELYTTSTAIGKCRLDTVACLVYLEFLSSLSVSRVTWMQASSCAQAQLQVGHLKPCDDKHALASAVGLHWQCMECI